MKKHLFDHVDIDQARTHVPEGSNPDAEAVCAVYEQAIEEAGGIDLQLLGLGPNGHIGFNEPEDTFPKATHCVDLTESTIQANSRLFDRVEDVPRQAYTMGIGTKLDWQNDDEIELRLANKFQKVTFTAGQANDSWWWRVPTRPRS